MRFLFVDRILALSSAAGSICGIKHITPADYYLSSDELERQYFIPALIGETLGQMTAWAAMERSEFRLRPVAGIVESVTMSRPAYVGETLELESWIDALDDTAVEYHGEVRIGSEVIFRLEGALGPMLPMDHFIDPTTVRRQFAEINRPGEWPYRSSVSSSCMTAESQHSICLQFDHITQHEPGVGLTAVKHVSRAAPYFADHFPHKPVLPLTILLECKMNLAKEFLRQAGWGDAYSVRSIRRIKMSDFVSPGDVVICQVSVKSQTAQELILRYISSVAGKRICGLEMVLVGAESKK